MQNIPSTTRRRDPALKPRTPRVPRPTPELIGLWEILIPVTHKDGTPVTEKDHRIWRSSLEAIGVHQFLAPGAVPWIVNEPHLVGVRMIPFRVACTQEQITQVANLTASYFGQDAILLYRVSDDVTLIRYDRSTF